MRQPVDPFDPALDQPRTVDFDEIEPEQRFPLSNHEIHCQSDRNSDLHELFWTWHDRPYARSIQVRLSAPIYTAQGISTDPVDEVMPLVVRFFPGYQETIYGTESGVIVSKRIFAPIGSGYDRALLWLLECQAEGDRLVQIQVEIDWGAPLEQRMVDGLLVAQQNPGEAKGIHGQQNAESTRIFGTDGGRPDLVSFPEPGRAQLLYHLLVAGQVDLPLILAVSDVGEQVAWNGFLGQRDISRTFKLSQDVWHGVNQRGRLWTPYPPLNWAVQQGKEAAMQDVRRLRSGYAPADHRTTSVPPLVDAFDAFDVERSRLLLDHLRRVAKRSDGRLPVELPALPAPEGHPAPSPPGAAPIETNGAYVRALSEHLSRHPHGALLSEHYSALVRCVEVLLEAPPEDAASATQLPAILYLASRLAGIHGDDENEARWVQAAVSGQQSAVSSEPFAVRERASNVGDWTWLDQFSSRQSPVADRRSPIITAGEALWRGCGVSVQGDEIAVSPRWPQEWGWWALVDLPVMGETLSLLWDGETLHSDRRVRFDGQTKRHERIDTEGSDPDNFNLRFVLIDGETRRGFRPIFYEEESARRRQPVRGLWMESK